MAKFIDINCDMGESFGLYTLGRDEEAIHSISSANIACGFHASDPMVMDQTVRLCRDHHVGVGAHPGYPDLMGFGRRFLDISPAEMNNYVVYQVGALQVFYLCTACPTAHQAPRSPLQRSRNQKDLFLQLVRQMSKAFGDPVFLTLATKQAFVLKETARARGCASLRGLSRPSVHR